MRRRYRWNPETLRQEEITPENGGGGLTIMPDIEPFVSPVDGSVITGRKALREHNRRHNVTNAADFKEEWAKKAQERASFYGGDTRYDRERRIEHLKAAYEKVHRR